MSEEHIDQKIREALERSSSEIELFADQQSLFQEALQIFKGRNRWINTCMAIVTFSILVFLIYAGFQFYHATELKEMIGWSMVIVVSALTISMLKIWSWLEMDKYSMIREIKRLEMQVAMLLDKKETNS